MEEKCTCIKHKHSYDQIDRQRRKEKKVVRSTNAIFAAIENRFENKSR